METLKVLKGRHAGRTLDLAGDEILIGRDAACDFVLAEATVSRRHARIVRRDGGLFLEDLGSRNGTFVNGRRIEGPTRLNSGDRIRIHEGLLTFLDSSTGAEADEASVVADDREPRTATNGQPEVVVDESDRDVSSSDVLMALDATSAGESRIALNAESKLHAVLEITRNLGNSLDLEHVLPKVLESALRIFPQADRGYILRGDAPDGPLKPVAIRHRHETDGGGGPATLRPISRTIARQVLAEGKAILSADSTHDARFESSRSVFDFEIRSMMCAPLIGPSRMPQGIVYVDTSDVERHFTSEDLDVLVSVATLAGQAMEYAQQHEARFRAVVEAALDCIVTIDQEGRIVEFNPAAEATFGYTRDEALGGELAELIIPPRDRDRQRLALSRVREAVERSSAALALARGSAVGARDIQPPPPPPYEGGEQTQDPDEQDPDEEGSAEARQPAETDGAVLGRRVEFTAMRKGGEEFPAELSIQRIPVNGPPMFTGFLRDITDRKRYEAQLKSINELLEQRVAERTKMLRLLHEVAAAANEAKEPEDAMRFAIERVCTRWNWRVGHVYWVDREAGVLVPSEIWYGTEDGAFERLRQITSQSPLQIGEGLPGRALQTGQAHWIEDVTQDPAWVRNREGELGVRAGVALPVLIEAEVVAVLEFYSEKAMRPRQRFLEVMADIGAQLGRVVERRRAEQAVRESEERFRAVFYNAAIGVALGDLEGRIAAINPALERMLGYRSDELTGRRFSEITHPDHVFRNLRSHRMLLSGQIDEYETERLYLRKDGEELWGQVSISAVRDLAGRTVHTIHMIQDVTGRKQLENEMADAATREQRRLGQELHDGVGQELTGLGFLARSLCQTLEAQGRPETEMAANLVSCLGQTLAQVRAIARGLVPVEIDAEGLRSALQEFTLNTAKRYSICCDFECRKNVRVEDSHVATQMFRIAQEAVNNAIKHGRPHRILIELDSDDGRIVLSIRDDGSGIGPESDRSDGTGLRIMQHRAGVIGATLDIRRAHPGGTAVTCTLG